MKEFLEHLNKVYVEQISNCSEICRKIVFGLFAVTWGLSYTKTGFEMNNFFLIVFLALIGYLILDILQYFLTAVGYRKHFNNIEKAYMNGIPEADIYRLEKDKRKMINEKSFSMLKWKFSLLPLAFLFLIIGIVDKFIK